MVRERKNKYTPDLVFPPGDTLKEVLEEIGMSQAELSERMSVTVKHVNSIVKGKASITEDTALRMERVLGVPASFWENLEQQYRSYLARKQERERLVEKKGWLARFPVNEMIKRRWIQKCNDPIEQLKELLTFFRVASWESYEDIWTEEGVAYRKSKAFKINSYALAAWLRKGEIEAESVKCGSFNEKGFKRQLKRIRKLSTEPPDVFLPKIKELCAECGVAVVFLKELPEIRVSGVTKWIKKDKALIQMSDRYKSDDHFWFTFFHEAGHILLHGKRDVFIENETVMTEDPKEEEANKFARDLLIPPKEYRKLTAKKPSLGDVELFAKRLQISPSIVVGRLQHDKILSFSVGHKFKQKIEF